MENPFSACYRTSGEQRSILERAFECNTNLSRNRVAEIAQQTGLAARTISNWFCVKRKKLGIHLPPNPPNPPQYRISDEQRSVLERAFQCNTNLPEERAAEIGQQIGLTAKTVRNWFKKRRRKIQRPCGKIQWPMPMPKSDQF